MTSLEQAFDYAAAAARLNDLGYHVSERWLREHIKQVPHTKVGRDVKFTDSLLAEFLEQRTHRPQPKSDDLRPVTRRRAS